MSGGISGRVGLFDDRRAVFSDCKTYRFLLESIWAADKGLVAFVMLNPSTADHLSTDPTNVRCRGFAEAWGHGGLRFVNLFAFRATDPRDMKRAADPVGPGNDAAILEACQDAALVVCAWGNHGAHLNRAAAVGRILQSAGLSLHALRLTKQGAPAHPLYLPKRLKPAPWTPAS